MFKCQLPFRIFVYLIQKTPWSYTFNKFNLAPSFTAMFLDRIAFVWRWMVSIKFALQYIMRLVLKMQFNLIAVSFSTLFYTIVVEKCNNINLFIHFREKFGCKYIIKDLIVNGGRLFLWNRGRWVDCHLMVSDQCHQWTPATPKESELSCVAGLWLFYWLLTLLIIIYVIVSSFVSELKVSTTYLITHLSTLI